MIKNRLLIFLIAVILSVAINPAYCHPPEKVKKASVLLININSAGAADLCRIPGIGPGIADRIINYRKKHGKFKRVEEIMKVKGIGAGRFRKIRKFLKI